MLTDDAGLARLKLGSETQLPVSASAALQKKNIHSVTWRNGLVAWNTLSPVAVRVAKDGDSRTPLKIGLAESEKRVWGQSLLTSDGTKLVARSGPSSFEVYAVEYPKVALIGHYELAYSSATKRLILRKTTTNKATAVSCE